MKIPRQKARLKLADGEFAIPSEKWIGPCLVEDPFHHLQPTNESSSMQVPL